MLKGFKHVLESNLFVNDYTIFIYVFTHPPNFFAIGVVDELHRSIYTAVKHNNPCGLAEFALLFLKSFFFLI